jgi:hypothetical protein
MKRVLILGAILFLATAFTSPPIANPQQQNAKENMIILIGYQMNYSALGAYEITVWVEYNPGTSTILAVYAEDQWEQPVDVVDYSGSITNDFSQLIATNFEVIIDHYTPGDYVTLNGNLTML